MHDHANHNNTETPRAHARRQPLAIALGITVIVLIVEVVGGIATNSLALLADAGHMATDVAALGLSLFAVWLAQRPPTPDRSFGFQRVEILAALANAALLIAITLYIFWEAFQRIGSPPDIDSGPMLVVAIVGLGANALSAWVLSRGGGHQHNLNTRGAFLHVVGDLLGSIGAIAAALIMLATGWYLADPILSAGIGILILWSSWRLLRESVNVLMEATPAHIDAREVQQAMVRVNSVTGVHDCHIWTVTSGLVAMSCHVEISGVRPWPEVLVEEAALLRERFGIPHVTLQPENDTSDTLFQGCSLDSAEGRAACLAQPSPSGKDVRA